MKGSSMANPLYFAAYTEMGNELTAGVSRADAIEIAQEWANRHGLVADVVGIGGDGSDDVTIEPQRPPIAKTRRRQAVSVRRISLYWQTNFDTGGNPGWAFNVISKDGQHTSGGLEVYEVDDGTETLPEVLTAFAEIWPDAAMQVTEWKRETGPEGNRGWYGTPS